jgi:hypothetical protein
MSVSPVVTMGLGSWGTPSLLITLGYGIGVSSEVPEDFICVASRYGATAAIEATGACPTMTATGSTPSMTTTGEPC